MMLRSNVAAWTMAAAAIFVALIVARPVAGAPAGQFISKSYAGRVYKLYIPGAYHAGSAMPLLVMLHGCTQDPDDFAAGTEMNSYAEQYGFLVAYPDQPSSANTSKCWNWFEPADQARGSGEPAIIAGIAGQVRAAYSVDSRRVYVAGISAGAAMAVIMGATYPDLFAAIGVSAGLEYKAAHDLTSALAAQQTSGPDPTTQGNAAYAAMGSQRRVVPVIVFYGSSDATVNPANGAQVVSQWAQTDDLAADGRDDSNLDDLPEYTLPGVVSGGHTYTRYLYQNSAGATIIERYVVNGMSHAWSGGNSGGSYTDPQGPKASLLMWDFFTKHPLAIPPTVTRTATRTATRTTTRTATRTATRTPTRTATRTPTRTPTPTK